ncbi:MAG: NADPH-dependent FMN reductase [Caldilineaceae bacterium]
MTQQTSASKPLRILAISGSLRAVSANTALLRAVARLAPPQVAITLYPGLADLPHFNPDLDGDNPPLAVLALREEIGRADGLLISSPEYAHGVPGSLKNALDWLVSSLEFPGKPVALLNASTRAAYAQAALAEILKTMSARLIEEASIPVALSRVGTDEATVLADPQIVNTLQIALDAFVRAIEAHVDPDA